MAAWPARRRGASNAARFSRSRYRERSPTSPTPVPTPPCAAETSSASPGWHSARPGTPDDGPADFRFVADFSFRDSLRLGLDEHRFELPWLPESAMKSTVLWPGRNRDVRIVASFFDSRAGPPSANGRRVRARRRGHTLRQPPRSAPRTGNRSSKEEPLHPQSKSCPRVSGRTTSYLCHRLRGPPIPSPARKPDRRRHWQQPGYRDHHRGCLRLARDRGGVGSGSGRRPPSRRTNAWRAVFALDDIFRAGHGGSPGFLGSIWVLVLAFRKSCNKVCCACSCPATSFTTFFLGGKKREGRSFFRCCRRRIWSSRRLSRSVWAMYEATNAGLPQSPRPGLHFQLPPRPGPRQRARDPRPAVSRSRKPKRLSAITSNQSII